MQKKWEELKIVRPWWVDWLTNGLTHPPRCEDASLHLFQHWSYSLNLWRSASLVLEIQFYELHKKISTFFSRDKETWVVACPSISWSTRMSLNSYICRKYAPTPLPALLLRVFVFFAFPALLLLCSYSYWTPSLAHEIVHSGLKRCSCSCPPLANTKRIWS